MSLRQIRRAKEVAGIKSSNIESLSGPSEDLDDVPAKKSAFAKLRELSSSSSSSSSEDEVTDVSPPLAAPLVSATPLAVRSRRRVKKAVPALPVEKLRIQSVLDPAVKIDPRALNPSSEFRRILGRAGSSSRRNRGIARRHWLIEPEKDWPMVVRDVFRMESCSDGSYRLVPESDYELKLRTFAKIVLTHDVEALYQFVHFNPFHPHGLIQLATILIEQRAEFESAYVLIRRALFAFQSAFLPSFHPFKSSLLLSLDSIFSSALLRALLLYAHLLAGQGCVRTALEVHKLIYLMEGGMATGCPLTHVLLHIDGLALQAGQTAWLESFLESTGLAESMPSCSLSLAIVSRDEAKLTETLNRFPSIIKALEINVGLGRPDILVNKLVQCARNINGIKRDEPLMAWIRHVVNEYRGSPAAQRVDHPAWLTRGYTNVRAAEMEWGKASKGFVEPAGLLAAEAQIFEVYSDEEPMQAAPPVVDHAVSLDSHPLVAFLGSLLPWSRVDVEGIEAVPITAASMIEQLRSAFVATIHSASDTEESEQDRE